MLGYGCTLTGDNMKVKLLKDGDYCGMEKVDFSTIFNMHDKHILGQQLIDAGGAIEAFKPTYGYSFALGEYEVIEE